MPGNPVKKRPQSDLVNQIPSDWSPELQKAYDKALKDYKAQMPAGDILDYVRTPFNVMSNSMAGLGAEMLGKGKQFEAKYGWMPKTQAEMNAVEAMMKVMGPVIDTMDYLKIPPIVGPNTPTIAAAIQGVDRAAARLTAEQAKKAAANAGQAAKTAVKDVATSDAAYNLANKVASATGAAPKQIMMGENSKTWNHGNAALAKDMELQGKDPVAIWQATGTFRAADGLWRQEIPDWPMVYTPKAARQRQTDSFNRRKDRALAAATTPEEIKDIKEFYKPELKNAIFNLKGKTSEFVDHPELRAAYPELFDRPFKQLEPDHPEFTSAQNVSGFFDTKTKAITINGDFVDSDKRDTTLHELQHAIQQIEGWQGGANPAFMSLKMYERDQAKQDLYRLERSLEGMKNSDPIGFASQIQLEEQELKNIQGQLNQTKQLENISDPFKAYERVSGEEEARAVERRSRLSDEDLKAWHPSENYDTPFSQQITKFADGGAVMMAKGGILGAIAKTAEKGLEAAAKGAKVAAPIAQQVIKVTQDILPAAQREENLQKFLSRSHIPQRLYHATPADIKVFKPGGHDPELSGPAVWLTNNAEFQPALHNTMSRRNENFKEGVNVMPVHVRAERPMLIDTPDMHDWAKEVYGGGLPYTLSKKQLEEIQKDYDSIHYADPYGRGDPHEVLMFDPNRIKSAIGNRGTYDINDPDITKATGGEVHAAKGGLLGVLAKTAEAGVERAAKAAKTVAKEVPPVVPATDYRGSHTAPGPHFGAPLHDVSSGGMYPSDFYGPNGRQYYGNEGWDFDASTYNKILNAKNKPDAIVNIFRAIPRSVHDEAMKTEAPLQQMIRPGDWVTLSKEYAKSHGESALNNDYKVVWKRVPAKEVWTNADSIHEWGYHPDTPKAEGGEVHMAGGGKMGILGALARTAERGIERALKTAPQDEALRLAQFRAALPPAQGGLGLPANNTPMQRAAAMRRDTGAYHGSKQDITGAFKPGYDDNLAFVTKSPDFANKWIGKGKNQKRLGSAAEKEIKEAEDVERKIKYDTMDYDSLNNLEGDEFHKEYDQRFGLTEEALKKELGIRSDKIHNTVYPLTVEANKIFNPETDMDVMLEFFEKNGVPQKVQDLYAGGNYIMYETKPVVEYLKGKGYDSMRLRESTGDDYPTIAVFNPESVRSRFAAHDPWRRDAATAAAFGVAAPDLLAQEQEPEKELTIDEFLKRMKAK